MFMPSIFGENFVDDVFDSQFRGRGKNNLMTTDVKDTTQGYEITIDMPGVKKENIKADLKDGYLTINATTSSDTEDNNGKYIRRERFCGTCSRSFYVGDAIKEDDVKAKFEDGTLKLFVPKKDAKAEVEEKKYIMIQ